MPGTDIASWMTSMEFLDSKAGSQGEDVWIENILILIHRLNGSTGRGATAGGTIRAASRAMSGILNMTELPSTKGALIMNGAPPNMSSGRLITTTFEPHGPSTRYHLVPHSRPYCPNQRGPDKAIIVMFSPLARRCCLR